MKDSQPFVILVVDDDDADRQLFRLAAERVSCPVEIVEAEGADNALGLLQNIKPDLILLDLNMPIKTGFDCLAELRAEDEFKTIPVCIFSTSNEARAVKNAFDLGANRYAVKPSSFTELQLLVQHFCSFNWQKADNSDFSNFVISLEPRASE